jgi:hypothetical protein
MFRHIGIIILCVASIFGLFAESAVCRELGPDASMKPARVFLVFTTRGYMLNTPDDLYTNDEVVADLAQSLPGLDFIVRDVSNPDVDIKDVMVELELEQDSLDGVVIVGRLSSRSAPYDITATGLPTVMVNNLLVFPWMSNQLFTHGREFDLIRTGTEYDNVRVVTCHLDRRYQCHPEVREAMYADVVNKIKLIEVLAKLKQTRILTVTPYDFHAFIDYSIGDQNKDFPADYNERYIKALRETWGVELVVRPPEEFYREWAAVSQDDAEDLADVWLTEAYEIQDTTKSEAIKTAKAYLALDAMRQKYDCHAVSTHMRQFTPERTNDTRFWPCIGVIEFQKHGVQAVCQEYPNVILSHLIGYYFSGRPSMLGDIIHDPYNDLTILTHCEHPFNPWGDDRRLDYTLKSHAESPVCGTKQPGSSVGVKVHITAGEPVTVWKVYALHGKIGVFTGETVDPDDYYRDIDTGVWCRTKLVTKVEDAAEIERHYSVDAYGLHRAGTFGDLRGMIMDLAHLVGYEVIEEDR